MNRIAPILAAVVLTLAVAVALLVTPSRAVADIPCFFVMITEHVTPEQAAQKAQDAVDSGDTFNYDPKTQTFTEIQSNNQPGCKGTSTRYYGAGPGPGGGPNRTSREFIGQSGADSSTQSSHSTQSGHTGTSSTSGCGSTAHGGPKPTKATAQSSSGCSGAVK